MKVRELPEPLPEEPGTRRIVPLEKEKEKLRPWCTKCEHFNFATHKQIMVTEKREWRTIQYCCGQHAEELAQKWGIVVQQEVRS